MAVALAFISMMTQMIHMLTAIKSRRRIPAGIVVFVLAPHTGNGSYEDQDDQQHEWKDPEHSRHSYRS